MKRDFRMRLLAVFLAGLVPWTAAAGQDSSWLHKSPLPQPDEQVAEPMEAPSEAIQQEKSLGPEPPKGLNHSLLKNTVVVFLRDDRKIEGKLLKLAPESLRLKVHVGTANKGKTIYRNEEIPLSAVVSVGRRVKPKLVGKEVVVYLHDGQARAGRLLELRSTSLVLQIQDFPVTIPLQEVARVKRQPIDWRMVLGTIAVGALLVGLAVLEDCPNKVNGVCY
jgi:hypothetical protein